MLNKSLADAVARMLREKQGRPATITGITSVGGGSINRAVRLETDTGYFFLKWNDAEKFPGMFAAEARGLDLLAKTGTLVVPETIGTGETDTTAFLLLGFLEKKQAGESGWREAGAALARLHKNTQDRFGLDHDNYIGSLPQRNRMHDSWTDFFTEERILPQVKAAYDDQRIGAAQVKQAENLCARLGEIFPAEKPALLHGDLWNGNFMFSAEGPAVFDPAVYYGHREMDLAMTELFGGFDAAFYEGYDEAFPLEKNRRKRIGCCNLYPLLVHVNLFGGRYVQDVKSILAHF
ncbi:MAG: fructosamine kinase [Bacteroidetes bacterium]|nr:MAG: fructosamine kinase [Bacteroidota bacterium]